MTQNATKLADIHRLGDHSADRRMLMLAALALVVGSGGALGACLLLKLIALASNLFWFGRWSYAATAIADSSLGLGMIAIPIIGSLMVGLMARFGSDKIRGHGIPEAIEAILYGQSRLSLKVALLKPLSSAISIGSGGPFGAEGPIIMTGGAIGSLLAQRVHLSAAERKTLLVTGAAAGMTAIFGTPVAAILLAVEVLLFEWKPRSLVPVVTGTLVALAWRPTLIGDGTLFHFSGILPSGLGITVAAAGLGVLVGCQSALLSSLLYRIEDGFHRLPIHWMWWPALGGLVVGIAGAIHPAVLGAGYPTIQALLDHALTVRAAVLLLAFKALAWLMALGSGTSGGILAPLLILGGAAGYLAGQWLPGDPGFWALLGMAGIMSGAMRAPLTGALFAVELTGRFDALPLTVAAAMTAFAVSVLVIRRSILTERIARRGHHVLQEYTVDPLSFLQARNVMTTSPATLPGTLSIAETCRFFEDLPRHRCYPVVDADAKLLGLVSRSDVLRWRHAASLPVGTLAEQVSDDALPIAYPDTPCEILADLMLESGMGRIPIIDRERRSVVGILTRHDLLKVRGHARRSEIERSRHPAHGPDAGA